MDIPDSIYPQMAKIVLGHHAIALDLATQRLSEESGRNPQELLREVLLASLQELDEMSADDLQQVCDRIIRELNWAKAQYEPQNVTTVRPGEVLVYWQHETSGRLKEAVETFLDSNEPLSELHRDCLATYFRIWKDYPGWKMDRPGMRQKLEEWKASFDFMVAHGTRESIQSWLEKGLELGIDPL
jgi:hypothetical protein